VALSEQRNTRPSMNSLAAPPRLIQNPDSIDNPTLDFFIRCWNEKRGDRAMPARAAFEMREIKDYVGWICLLDALPDFRDFRYRLVGSRVADYFLGDGTGKTIRELFSGDDKPLGQALLWVYQKTCRERLPLRISAPAGKWRGRYFPDTDSLYLPLSKDGEVADMAMTIFTFNYEEYRKTMAPFSLSRTA
jgi:hypothetical protein